MPRGLGKIQQIAKENAAKRAAYEEGGSGLRFFKLDDGESAKVRFLEQGDEVWYNWTHQLPKMPGQRFGDSVMCLDQDDTGAGCPGCERGKSRSARMTINLIWFGAPKFERDKDNKIVKDGNDKPKIIGKEDIVAVWNTGSNNGGRLDYLDTKYGGIVGSTFTITRQGATKDDTKYFIDIEDKDQPPSSQEVELFKAKPDPRKAIKSMSYGDMARAFSGGGVASDSNSGQTQANGEPAPDLSNNVFAQSAGGAVNRGAFGN